MGQVFCPTFFCLSTGGEQAQRYLPGTEADDQRGRAGDRPPQCTRNGPRPAHQARSTAAGPVSASLSAFVIRMLLNEKMSSAHAVTCRRATGRAADPHSKALSELQGAQRELHLWAPFGVFCG